MGEKGARSSAAGAAACQALVADLGGLGEIVSRKMFGGYGIFADEVMFALVDSAGACFLKADPTNLGGYETANSSRHGGMPYWEIPAAVRADPSALAQWAAAALEVARAARR